MELGLPDESDGAQAYQVLARKYRPRDFSTLYGQDALVRTLTNAMTSGRLAQAFMLTGVRGVGKTTTARILAKALNCTGPGVEGPTPNPCGTCKNCTAILNDSHPDVLEMDAASHTGIDDIRELQKSVAYRPTLGRYKIYIIDEVHMLSNNAFNALLKTLEEPPEQVIFVFATTEIRKVPVTVLSRCQRYDLRRIDMQLLVDLFTFVVGQEGWEAEVEALALIARAADGSARDGLSILDQALALSGSPLTAQTVQDMLGLADRARMLDLAERLLGGDVSGTLSLFDNLYENGAAPLLIVTDLAELVHWMTRAKIGAATADLSLGEAQRTQGRRMADSLSMAHLARAWQMLVQAVAEVKAAGHPKEATDMALIRLAYAADLPTPDEIAKEITANKPEAHPPLTRAPESPAPASSPKPASPSSPSKLNFDSLSNSSRAAPNRSTVHPGSGDPSRSIGSLEDILVALEEERQMKLAAELRAYVRVVSLQPGSLEIAKHDRLPRNLPKTLSALLKTWTGQTWRVILSEGADTATVAETEFNQRKAQESEALNHPLVAAARAIFPDAEVVEISLDENRSQAR